MLALAFLVWQLSPAGPISPYLSPLILGVLAVELAILYAFPSVRRIGLSPLCLVVDTGIRKFTYPWADVHQVTRKRTERFRWTGTDASTVTRISVGAGFADTWFTLSPTQGERLARFLRIP